MPRVHATSAHSFSGDKLLELMKLSLEDKEEVPPEEVDPNDPCSMCPCCRGVPVVPLSMEIFSYPNIIM